MKVGDTVIFTGTVADIHGDIVYVSPSDVTNRDARAIPIHSSKLKVSQPAPAPVPGKVA